MFDFFGLLLGYINAVWQFFQSLLSSLLLAVTFLVTSLSLPNALLSYMPPIIGSAILCFMAVFLVRFLIGK